eukprot:7800009-Ditylum_brightwellii.AAC.1
MKTQMKAALKKFAKIQFPVDELVKTVDDPFISTFIQNLFSGTKSKSYSQKQVPGVHKVLLKFLKAKNIYVSHNDTGDDQLVRLGIGYITNMTGITGGAASFDKRFREIGDPVPSETNNPRNNTKESLEDDEASGQMHITGSHSIKNMPNL